MLAEIQRVADAKAKTCSGIDDPHFATMVLAAVVGTLEARIPSGEWNRVDVYRQRRARGDKP